MPTTSKTTAANGKMELTVLRRKATRYFNMNRGKNEEIERLHTEIERLCGVIDSLRIEAGELERCLAAAPIRDSNWEKLQAQLAQSQKSRKEIEAHATLVDRRFQEAQAQIGKAVDQYNQAQLRAQEAETRAQAVEQKYAALQAQHRQDSPQSSTLRSDLNAMLVLYGQLVENSLRTALLIQSGKPSDALRNILETILGSATSMKGIGCK